MEKPRKERSKFGELWRQLRKNKVAVAMLFVIVAVILVAIFAPFIAPYSFREQNRSNPYAPPNSTNLLGTDGLGRDIFSRLIYGARMSLQIGVIAVGIAASVGIFFGSVAGYFGGWTDNLMMRFLDIYQSMPMFLLCVTFASILGPSLRNAIIAIGISMVPSFARLMRASILTVREMEYIDAAKVTNVKTARIITKHIIPNSIAPLIVSITMSFGNSVLAGAGLSFIGLGVQPPIPEWGAMISDARNFMRSYPMLAVYPGICIMVVVLAFNLLGDGLRDALDPRQRN